MRTQSPFNISSEYYVCCVCVQEKGQEGLAEKLGRNVGTAIGLELRDSTQALSTANSKPVKAGMTFNVSVGEPPYCWGLGAGRLRC